jgi:hypothetical protein
MSVSCYESFKQGLDLDSALIIGINVFFSRNVKVILQWHILRFVGSVE